jgi:hypothetical protein
VRFHCAIYNQDSTFGFSGGWQGGGPVSTVPMATVTVSGHTAREAAARAYVRCVGRERARRMRQKPDAPRGAIAQETNFRAIAACLRKTTSRLGECYQLDNLVEAWYITAEPDRSTPRLRKPLRRLRLPHSLLFRLLSRPLPG